METRTYNVYKFDELTEEQKQKAIERYNDINVDFDWWDFIEEDMAIKLICFDMYHGHCEIKPVDYLEKTAKHIVENHGEKTDTYQLAKTYLDDLAQLEKDIEANNAEIEKAGNEDIDPNDVTANEKLADRLQELDEIAHGFDDKRDELDSEFLNDLTNETLKLLQEKYEYRTSEEAVAETLVANDYWFTEDSKID